MSEPLSPAAQVVLDAFLSGIWESTGDRQRLAAALRAAALYCKRDGAILLAIADELEAL